MKNKIIRFIAAIAYTLSMAFGLYIIVAPMIATYGVLMTIVYTTLSGLVSTVSAVVWIVYYEPKPLKQAAYKETKDFDPMYSSPSHHDDLPKH